MKLLIVKRSKSEKENCQTRSQENEEENKDSDWNMEEVVKTKMKTEKDAKEEVELIFREEVENKLQLWKLVRNMMQ